MIIREAATMADLPCKIRRRDFHAIFTKPVSTLILVLAALTGILSSVAGDPATDKLVMLDFKEGITNSDVLSWTGSEPCAWNTLQVECDSAGNVLQIRVREKGLTGTVTPKLNQLSSLTYLELNFNAFTGAMPSLKGMATLETAALTNNNFDSIPADVFDGLVGIKEILIEHNSLLNASTGGWAIPPGLKDASATLTTLRMSNVSATGEIPSYLGEMAALKIFFGGFNKFTGGIPASFSKSGIQTLRLNNQATPGLDGELASIGGMSSLTTLYLHGNSFSGPVPEGLASAAGLAALRLSNNPQLVGRLPLGLGSLPLEDLWIGDNKFCGEMPPFSNVTNVDSSTFCGGPGVKCSPKVDALLDFLAAAGYPLAIATTWTGPDPCSPRWSGITCDPTTGDITAITLPKSGLVGTISPSLALLPSLGTLTLSGNAFTGPIPTELTTLTSLKTVDVSDNNLSGPLPLFPSSVKFTYTGNPLLTGATPPIAAPPAVPPAANPPTIAPPIAPASAPPPGGGIAPDSAPTPVGSNVPTTAPSPASIAPRGSTPTPGILPPGSSPAPTVLTASKKKSIIGPVVGAVVGGIALCALGIWFLCYYHKKASRKKNAPTENQHVHPETLPSTGTTADPEFVKIVVDSGSTNGSYHPDGQRQEPWNMGFTIDELRSVTNNFAEHNVLGRGGFGVVYRGVLADGTKIAVKRMEAAVVSSKGMSEFQSEIAVLTKVKHRHLVSLLGYCTDGVERLLVYEYMSQGTLTQHLFKHEEMNAKPLSWTTRLVIALDVAQGVEYLHSLAHRSFIHRDLKPSNVLLNDDFRAKVSDFGLVKLAPDGNLHSVETRLAGTFGYLAPEYAVTGRVTTKADVFSFGVILMELLTGRRAVDETQSEEDMYLVSWFTAKMRSRQETQLRRTIDPTIGDIDDETTFKSITTVAELAGHCTAREPTQRCDMGYVVSVLRPLVDEWKPMQMDHDADASIRDMDMSLSKALRQWQEFKDESITSSTVTDNSATSLPARPGGFADSFASTDGR